MIKGFTAKNYHVIGALKTNRVIYPDNAKISIAEYAKTLTKDQFHSVTVKGVEYMVFRYVGRLNSIETFFQLQKRYFFLFKSFLFYQIKAVIDRFGIKITPI